MTSSFVKFTLDKVETRDRFYQYLSGYATGIGTTIWMPRSQWSIHEWYRSIVRTNHRWYIYIHIYIYTYIYIYVYNETRHSKTMYICFDFDVYLWLCRLFYYKITSIFLTNEFYIFTSTAIIVFSPTIIIVFNRMGNRYFFRSSQAWHIPSKSSLILWRTCRILN